MCIEMHFATAEEHLKDGRNYTRGVNANVTHGDEKKNDEMKKKTAQSLVFLSFHSLKARDFFFFFFFLAGKIPFSIRWMQLQLSNSCWSFRCVREMPPRVISSNLATEEDDFRAVI